MKQELYENSKDYINRWVISYADFVTILFALFIVIWALTGGMDINIGENQNILKGVVEQKQEQSKETQKEQTQKEEEKSKEENKQTDLEKFLEENPQITANFNIIHDKKGIILRSENTIFFDEGSAEIKPAGLEILEQTATTLKNIDNPLIIEGHTDTTPINTAQYPSNWELSTARATNIVKYLINNCGYSPKRLSAVGYGEFAPIVANDNVKNKAKNRRVDIIILDSNNHMEK